MLVNQAVNSAWNGVAVVDLGRLGEDRTLWLDGTGTPRL